MRTSKQTRLSHLGHTQCSSELTHRRENNNTSSSTGEIISWCMQTIRTHLLSQAAHCMLECECAGRARFIIYYGNDRRWPEVNGKYNESSDARGRKGAESAESGARPTCNRPETGKAVLL
jgi:hypothetical protein